MVAFDKHRAVSSAALCLIFSGQILSSGLGRCPKMKYLENFNLTRFTGRWYEIERSFYLVQIVSSCVSVDLTENSRGQVEVDVRTRSRWSGSLTVSEGVASPGRRDPSLLVYKVSTKLPRVISRYLPGAGVYQILATDYDTYAVLWSCTNYGVAHTDLMWIWGRRREIDARLRIRVYSMLENMRLDPERLILPQNCSLI